MPRLAKVRWLDNCYREGPHDLESLGTGAELTYYGILVKETEVAVTLSLEEPEDGKTRNPFDILRRNIIEMQIVDALRAFPKHRKVKTKDAKEKVSPKPDLKPDAPPGA